MQAGSSREASRSFRGTGNEGNMCARVFIVFFTRRRGRGRFIRSRIAGLNRRSVC